MSEPAVRGRGLEKRFGGVRALRGLDFEIPAASATALLGPNGAGKSTLLRILAGLSQPTAGSVEVRGRSGRDRRNARAAVGFVGHETLLYPELSARENLIFAGRLHGLGARAPERADALLAEEGLEAVASRLAGGFSRGMAQRLSIARARVGEPTLLLLDEPFTGLDPASSERLAERLRSLAAAGQTLLVALHDLALASALCERALILVAGRLGAAVDTAEGRAALDAAYRDAASGAAA